MKELKIIGLNGAIMAQCLVDMKGDDWAIKLNLPMYLPIVEISITEKDKHKEDKELS